MVVFITGTDTGVGKTVLTCLLTRYLRERGLRVAALKPLCSGGRDDALALHRALDGTLTLAEINPWHFRAPLAPSLAARREGKRVTLADVLAHARRLRRRHDVTLIEGAGGLLSPLGEGFNARDVIVGLRAWPVVVCPNRLGAVNQVLLVWEALPARAAARATVVLVDPVTAGSICRSNASLLRERLGASRVHRLPWLSQHCSSWRTRRFASALWDSSDLAEAMPALRSRSRMRSRRVVR